MFTVWLAPVAIAQNSLEGSYRQAIRLFRAMYPELAGRNIELDFDSQTSLDSDDFPLIFDIGISNLKPTPPSQDSTSEVDRVGSLGVRFQFNWKDHRVMWVYSSGSIVASDKREMLDKLVNANQDWSEAQMTEALLSAGAKFGPNQKDSILAKFPAKELAKVLGRIQIISASFTFRGNKEPPFYSVMQWTIRFRTINNKHLDEYFVSLEPFEGKIVTLGRSSHQ